MENNEDLQQKLLDAINTHLDLCDGEETPQVCHMIATDEGRKEVVALVVNKVMQAHMEIPEAIVSIENEYNPNALD